MLNNLLRVLILCFSALVSLDSKAQQYDSILAKKLGADDYGMKMYVLVILKAGSREITDAAIRDSLFTGHMQNIDRLAREEKLVVAGPMGENEKGYRGIFILNVSDVHEAERILQTDPTISSGILAAEFYPWYGSAALPTYLPTHEKIQKSSI